MEDGMDWEEGHGLRMFANGDVLGESRIWLLLLLVCVILFFVIFYHLPCV
jgi:hypothetical protein